MANEQRLEGAINSLLLSIEAEFNQVDASHVRPVLDRMRTWAREEASRLTAEGMSADEVASDLKAKEPWLLAAAKEAVAARSDISEIVLDRAGRHGPPN